MRGRGSDILGHWNTLELFEGKIGGPSLFERATDSAIGTQKIARKLSIGVLGTLCGEGNFSEVIQKEYRELMWPFGDFVLADSRESYFIQGLCIYTLILRI